MHLPSPASSPSLTSTDISPPPTSRKRQRSRSMQSNTSSSSVKRSVSECPSHDGAYRSPRAEQMSTLSLSDSNHDIDAYMAEQGEADIPTTISLATSTSMPPAEKLSLVENLRAKTMEIGETWYLVSIIWWKRWRKACTGEIDKEGRVEERDLGPVNNALLLDDYGNLKPSLIEQVDVEYVPAQVWSHLITWYGDAFHPLPRKVIARGEAKVPSLELRPPKLKAYLVSKRSSIPESENTTPFPYITLSSQDTVKILCSRLANALLPDNQAPYRIWKVDPSVESSGIEISKTHCSEILEESDKTLDEALIQFDDAFAVEFKHQTSGWIITPPSKSPTIVTGRHEVPPPLFSSETGFFNRLGSDNKSSSSISDKPKPNEDYISNFLHSTLKPLSAAASSLTSTVTRTKTLEPGTLGLGNMGNTCFMNSALQCLAHTKELSEYFLTGVFQEELNPDNPLGMHGAIAESFGALLQRIWAGQSPASHYSPREFKQALQRFAPQFSGYQQHDSQELVAFLLDGLHEDLNRVLKKPYVEKPDWEGQNDLDLVELARKSWEGYMKRNDSVIVDLFQGQYQSTLVCPECQKVSITFDPFMYLTLPLPVQKKWRHTVYYIPWDLEKPHVQIPVEISRDASFKDLRQLLGRWMNTQPDNLLTLEVFSHRFYKNLDDNVPCGDMNDSDTIVCFELPCHAQQSRTHKKSPEDPFILPVYLCDVTVTSRYSYTRNSITPFGYPFIVVIDNDQAQDVNAMYDAVVNRLERWTDHARDLYKWEVTSDEMEEVPIQINGMPLADAITEISENGEIVTVQEASDEGDIVDARGTILQDEDDSSTGIISRSSSDSEVPRKVGTKQDLFALKLQTNHKEYGTGHGFASNANRFETWESRMEDAALDPVLLRTGDAFFCEFDENIKRYFFGDERSKFEHAKWDNWQSFTHPEYDEAKKASAEKKNKGISLQDCLDEFTKEEQLGEDDLWYCPKCKKHQQATKKFDLWKAPDILVVHLKRFSNSRTLRDKIDVFVDFPVEGLDLSDMIGERQVAKRLLAEGVDVKELNIGNLDEPLIYDLYGVDEHLGGLGGGHYRAYVLHHVTEKWYHFDDTYVTTTRATEAVNPNAYLLFYRRRSNKPLGGKTYEKVEEALGKIQAGPNSEPMVVDNQLPTPPSETTSDYMGTGVSRLTALSKTQLASAPNETYGPHTRSSTLASGFSVPSPPPEDNLPGFEESQYNQLRPELDPLQLASHHFDFPDPSGPESPTSSIEAQPDLDLDLDLDDSELGDELWHNSSRPSLVISETPGDWIDLTKTITIPSRRSGSVSPFGSSGSENMDPFSNANEQYYDDDTDTKENHIPEKAI